MGDLRGSTAVAAAPADHDTKHRILDVAEQLFADEGFEKVSLRHLTQSAGVNLAAVNYHFGSKDALIDAVLERFVTPLNQERLANLDALEAARPEGEAIPLPDIIRAFLQPFFTLLNKSELSERLFFKLMGRCMSDPGYRLPESTMPLFQQLARRFGSAFGRTVPELSPELIFWRLHFTFGILAQTMVHNEAMDQITEGKTGNPSPDEILERIIDFAAAGFAAPVSKP